MIGIWKKYLHNKFFYTGLAFVIWMLFFDEENIIEQIRLTRTLNELEGKKSFYQEEIKQNEVMIKKIETDPDFVEKLAREKYYMKKDDEDVYVIIGDEK